MLVYVDDIAIASNNSDYFASLKAILSRAFNIKDLGLLCFFLGLEIARSSKGVSVYHRKYTLDLLEYVGLIVCKPSIAPMNPYVYLSKDTGQPLDSATPYRELLVDYCIWLSPGQTLPMQSINSSNFFSSLLMLIYMQFTGFLTISKRIQVKVFYILQTMIFVSLHLLIQIGRLILI